MRGLNDEIRSVLHVADVTKEKKGRLSSAQKLASGLQRNILETCKVKHAEQMLGKEDVKAGVKSDRTRMGECAKAVMSLLDMLEQFCPRE
jgi:hypothetical protein